MSGELPEIDNSGEGNCMYYAYSISLMSYLSSLKETTTAKGIFAKLHLNEGQVKQLLDLLSKTKDKVFKREEVRDIIQPILGPATRRLAAERTRDEFLDKPESTPLFTAAAYGFDHIFGKLLADYKSPIADYFDTNKFDISDFTDAEIYRVPEMRAKMALFAETCFNEIEADIKKYEEDNKDTLEGLSKSDRKFKLNQQINELTRKYTIEFFTRNNNENLTSYVDHLNTNYRWGSEETVLTLNRAITGEKITHDDTTDTNLTTYDYPIQLVIFKDGLPSAPFLGEADMILNNHHNVHWTSLIPVEAYTYKFENKKITEKDSKTTLLQLSGFDSALKKLLDKAESLIERGHVKAAKEATAMYDALLERKKAFLKLDDPKTRKKDAEVFIHNCRKSIRNASINELKEHRGFGKVMNFLLNSLIFVASLSICYIVTKTFRVIEPSLNDSMKKVNELTESLDDLEKQGASLKNS